MRFLHLMTPKLPLISFSSLFSAKSRGIIWLSLWSAGSSSPCNCISSFLSVHMNAHPCASGQATARGYSRRSMSVIWCLAANVGFWGMCGLCWVQEGRADGRICFFSWKGTGWCICLSSGHSVHIKGFFWNKQESSKASYFTKNFYD